jgi:hypothetical protein
VLLAQSLGQGRGQVGLLLLRIGFLCFAEERDLKEWQLESLQYFANGSANLLAHKPWRALEDFQRSNALLDKTDKSTSVISFLISFGQAIAFDSLGFREECKEAIGSLFLIINEYNLEDGQDSGDNSEDDFSDSKENEEAVQFLHNLAAISPSSDVRELLLSLVNEIAEELLPAFKMAESLGTAEWDFDYAKDDRPFMQCKSWKKKLKKWWHEVAEWVKDAVTILKGIEEAKKTYDKWKNSNQTSINKNIQIEDLQTYLNVS